MKAQLFEIRHVTAYNYRTSVTVAHHLLRLRPRRSHRQWLLEHTLQVEPAPATTSQRLDYFGNHVTFVTLEGAHERLVVISRNRVAVGPAFVPDPAETPAWEHVGNLCRGDGSAAALEATEFTFPSSLVPTETRFADYAAPSFPPGRPVLAAVLELNARIHADFTFDPSVTTLTTPLAEVLAQRRGVCQDFAHFMIACLRSLGLPARYVSGYLETVPPPGQSKLIGADASHAWVAFFCPGLGWVEVDPTNNLLPSMQHITLGWGRDYGDVSPIRGVLVGGKDHTLRVGVDVTACGSVESTSPESLPRDAASAPTDG